MMYVLRQRTDLHDEVAFYLEEIIGNLLTVLVALAYIWLLWTLRPFGEAPDYIWMPIGCFLLTLLSVHGLTKRDAPIAILVLVWGLFLTILLVSAVYNSVQLVLFQIAPLVLALSLLSTRVIWGVVIGTYFNLIGIAWLANHSNADLAIVAIVIALVIVFVGLSARYLQSVMMIVWNQNTELDRMIKIARDRGGELRSVVKQLDENNQHFIQMNRKLEWATQQAYEARQMKQEFAQNITHELRTPLNLIIGFIELMIQTPQHYGNMPSQSFLRDLDIVYNNACHLQALIDDILDISRIEAAQMTMNPQPTDFAKFLIETCDTIRNLVESKGLYLQLNITGNISVIELDQTRIRQVLFNLINNATRFTSEGGITIQCKPHEIGIICSVSDTGAGILPEDKHRIFDTFHQARNHEKGGTGLGLAISKRFIEMHGGTIWVESVVNKGSNFYFTLPITQSFFPSMPHVTGGRHSQKQLTDSTPKSLLVISQSQSSINLLHRYLPDYEIIAISDPERIQQVSKTLVPSAVLIDSLSEDKLTSSLEVWDLWKDIPIISCPLAGEEYHRQELAIDAFLMKPVLTEQIRQLMRQFGSSIDTVMVVDDNKDFVRYIARILDHPLRRYNVINAYGGRECLKLMELGEPDIILLDLEMEDMTGMELIQILRNDPNTANIPIVVITGYEAENNNITVNGKFSIYRGSGIQSNEIIQWIRSVLEI